MMNNFICTFIALFTGVSGRYSGPTNQAAINIIKEFTTFRPNFYNDSNSGSLKYIGHGYLCRPPSICVLPLLGKFEVPLTPQSAESLLKEELSNQGGPEACVNKAVTYYHLNSNQFSALVSFVHNMGCGTFKNSFLLTSVNRRDMKEAEHDFGRYIYFKGKIRDKLVRRREAERRLFSTKTSQKEMDCFGLSQREENVRKSSSYIIDLFLLPILELCKKMS